MTIPFMNLEMSALLPMAVLFLERVTAGMALWAVFMVV